MTDKTDKDKELQELSAEDLQLLKDVMGDVQVYEGKEIAVPEVKSADPQEKQLRVEPKLTKPEKKQINRESKGLDKRTDERLRRGQMDIEARLDMHGMTYDQGKAALERFILDAYVRGKRCVLVITGRGKGKSSEEDWLATKPGVLKRSVPEWMKEEKLRGLVLKHYPARHRDGGEGALYVLLRRKRD